MPDLGEGDVGPLGLAVGHGAVVVQVGRILLHEEAPEAGPRVKPAARASTYEETTSFSRQLTSKLFLRKLFKHF